MGLSCIIQSITNPYFLLSQTGILPCHQKAIHYKQQNPHISFPLHHPLTAILINFPLIIITTFPIMDEKTQRYMQRIQKIMFTPRKSANPARPSKSPLTSQPKNLDRYLKYELSSKIVQGVITRNHQRLVNQFFTAIRTTQIRQKEKVYKFIAVEKSDKVREIQIDGTISGKILGATLKGLVRMRYIDFVNSLQAYFRNANSEMKTPASKNKLVRAISERQPQQSKETRMRTPTVRERVTSLAVSEWVDKSMAESNEKSDKQQKEKQRAKMKQVAVRFIVKVMKTKIDANQLLAVSNMEIVANRKQKTQQINHAAVIPQLDNTQTNQKIYNSARSIHSISAIFKRRLLLVLTKLKSYDHYQQVSNAAAKTFLLKLSSFLLQHNIKQSHLFLSSLRSISYQKQQSSLQARSKSGISNSPISHISEISQVQPFNPLAKLNFYTFVDKIFKFIIIVSKLLIPIKEAFNRIDHYASFAYRLEESLRTAPRHYLLQAFAELKEYARKRPARSADPSLHKPSCPLYECLSTSINERLIEGFTHIKIMSKERDLKIKIFPARQNIVETTKQFIQERESYTSMSHEHWSGLKSLLLSPKNHTHNGYVRKASHEI